MERISRGLSDYVVRKGVVSPEERDLYQYGFQMALELGTSILCSMLIAVRLRMVFGGMLFFAVFIPLRSYAGGLHLKHYLTCLTLSCITFTGVLLAAKYIAASDMAVIISSVCYLVGIRLLHPVNHSNRKVDEQEERHFSRCLNRFLLIDGILLFLFAATKQNTCVKVISYTLLLIFSTMLIGKLKK